VPVLKSGRGNLAAAAAVLATVLAVPTAASAAVAFKDEGAPGGPLNHVEVGVELSCQVQHVGDSTFEFYPPAAEPGDCGTFLVDQGTNVLFAPDFANHAGTATGGLGSFTPFAAVSQTAVTGSGTSGDPFKIVTIANAISGAANFTITETDTYVAGSESYHTDVAVKNNTGTARNVVLYRGGDCFLQDSDSGFGFAAGGGNVGCSANPNNSPPNRIEEWVPTTPGSSFTEDFYSSVWSKIGAHGAFVNDCAQCTSQVDNGAGLSWGAFSIPAGGTVTQGHNTTFSPTGGVPPTPPPTPSGGSTPPPPIPVVPPTSAPARQIGPAGNPLGLPSAKKCIDKRKFSFKLRRPAGRVVDVQISVNGVPTGHKTGSNITRLTIAKLPNSGKFKVKIVATSADGTVLVSQRTYTRCKKSKVKGRKTHGKR
jgi:hypothetical protein